MYVALERIAQLRQETERLAQEQSDKGWNSPKNWANLVAKRVNFQNNAPSCTETQLDSCFLPMPMKLAANCLLSLKNSKIAFAFAM